MSGKRDSIRDSNGEAVAELPLKINIFIIRQPYTKLSYRDGWTSKPIGLVFRERCVNLCKRTSTKKRTTVFTVARPNRAVSGTRTRDPRLGKPMLYQLSYYRMLSVRKGDDRKTKLQKIW